jgi:hypothetical protein
MKKNLNNSGIDLFLNIGLSAESGVLSPTLLNGINDEVLRFQVAKSMTEHYEHSDEQNETIIESLFDVSRNSASFGIYSRGQIGRAVKSKKLNTLYSLKPFVVGNFNSLESLMDKFGVTDEIKRDEISRLFNSETPGKAFKEIVPSDKRTEFEDQNRFFYISKNYKTGTILGTYTNPININKEV